LTAQDGSSEQAQYALETLCRDYWYPLYAYVRRRGYAAHDAQDLTQEFFAQFLSRDYLQTVHPSKGRFRSFLLACLNHFLAKQWRKSQAQKRGGGTQRISVDELTGEGRYRLELSDEETPETLYYRRWALDLLEKVMRRLECESAEKGNAGVFQHLRGVLSTDETTIGYAALAADLGMTEGAVKKAAERLRKRYQHLLRVEIASTVADADQIDDEIACLIAALRRQVPTASS